MADGERNFEEIPNENLYMKKYLALRNKCEQLQQGNEKIVNRLQHVKKLVKRYKRERRVEGSIFFTELSQAQKIHKMNYKGHKNQGLNKKRFNPLLILNFLDLSKFKGIAEDIIKFLQNRLDTHKDNYKEAQVPVMWEEDQMYNMFRPPPPSPPSKDLTTPTGILTHPTASPTQQKPKSAKKIKTLLKTQDQHVGDSNMIPTLPPFLQGLETEGKNIDSMLFGGAGLKQEYDLTKTPIKLEPIETKKSLTKSSAFLLFCEQYRQYIQNQYLREKNEIISPDELTRRLALKWNTLSPDDKRVYQDMYEIQNKQQQQQEDQDDDTVESLDSESTLAAIHVESDTAVTSILVKQKDL